MTPSLSTSLDRKVAILTRSAIVSPATLATRQELVDVGTLQRAGKGYPLVCQGDPATQIALVGSGRLRLVQALPDGRTLTLGYRGAGECVGDAALGRVPAYSETAVATEEVEALMVPVSTVRVLFAADPGFASGVLAMLVERQRDTEDRLTTVLFRTVEDRLAALCARVAARWGIPEPRGVLLALRFPHQEIADLIGSTRETVTLILGNLRRKGLIEVDHRRIVVLGARSPAGFAADWEAFALAAKALRAAQGARAGASREAPPERLTGASP